MKFIRLLLSFLVWTLLIVALLALAALVPLIQTWAAQLALSARPGLHGSIGSLAAGFGEVDVADVQLETDGGKLTLPSLAASLPLAEAVWDRQVQVHSLVAKGWTLDLRSAAARERTRAPAASPPGGGGPPPAGAEPAAQAAAEVFHGLFGLWRLPCSGTWDGIDLEGDVLLPGPSAIGLVRSHVVIKGGGLAAGREGVFQFEVRGTASELPLTNLAGRGRLALALDSARTIDRIEITGNLAAQGVALLQNLSLSALATVDPRTKAESYALDLGRGGRPLASIHAGFPAANGGLGGTWTLAVRDADLATFLPDLPLPGFTAAGEGSVAADAAFGQLRASGRLRGVVSKLGVLAPGLERLGTQEVETRFALTQAGRTLRVEALSVALGGARPIATVQSLQPFEVDLRTGDLKLGDRSRDFLQASLHALPLAWLAGLTGPVTLAGGDASGEGTVRAVDGGWALRGTQPFTAAGVSVARGERALARGLDLSLALTGSYSSQGWQAQASPLALASGGRRWGAIEAKASSLAGSDQPVALAGTWSADLTALPAAADGRWIGGRAASGEFSASIGAATTLDAKLAASGRDPARAVAASVHVDLGADGSAAFHAPIKLTRGASLTELAAEGTWTPGEGLGRTEMALTGGTVALEDLRLLAGPLASAGGGASAAAGPDRTPFWGAWAGQVTIGFDHLRALGRIWDDVGGTLTIDRGALRLKGARAGLPLKTLADGEGSITFDPAGALPYRLAATATAEKIDSARVLGAAAAGPDAAIEGRFSVAGKLDGEGATLADLARGTRAQVRVTSASGIIRFLKTNVADAIPQVDSPVADTLGTVGTVFGAVLGRPTHTAAEGKNPVSKNAEAVLDFTNQVAEIGCDQIAFTAVRGPGSAVRLEDISILAPDERLTGTGEIGSLPGRSLALQPLQLELRLAARGRVADLLAAAGLLSPGKDEQGFRRLAQPIRLGGTLAQIDERQWHDLLAAAARQPPAAK